MQQTTTVCDHCEEKIGDYQTRWTLTGQLLQDIITDNHSSILTPKAEDKHYHPMCLIEKLNNELMKGFNADISMDDEMFNAWDLAHNQNEIVKRMKEYIKGVAGNPERIGLFDTDHSKD